MNRISRWLLPTVVGGVGPFALFALFVWLYSRSQPPPPRPPLWDPWIWYVPIGVWMVLVFVVTDVFLLWLKVRGLPMGRRSLYISLSAMPLFILLMVAPSGLGLPELVHWGIGLVGLPVTLRLVFNPRLG